MKDFLWMLYLAFTIFITYDLIMSDISKISRKLLVNELTQITITSILWAIWYIYFLH